MRDGDRIEVAERLAVEFPHVPAREVVTAVKSAAGESPDGDSLFLEQAARARLVAQDRKQQTE